MNKLIFIFLIISLYGCSKKDDDTENICTNNCTTLEGKFITLDNVGIEGVRVSLKYRIYGGLLGGGSIRSIVDTQTDKNGNFYAEFYIKDNELGETDNGHFEIEYDDKNLDVTKYILSDNRIGTTTQPLGQVLNIHSRDTKIGNTYYLPKKTNIKVNLKNFIPLKDGDYFEVLTFYPFGADIGTNDFLDTKYSTGFSGWGTFKAEGISSELNPFVAENEENIIRIARRKNGVNTTEDFPLFVPTNNTIELSYEY